MYKFTAIAVTFMSAVVFTAPAHSQSIEIGPNGIRVNPDGNDRMDRNRRIVRGEISERQAARIARSEGMDEVESISRRRNTYVIRGIDRRDDDMRVTIDRRTGEILEIR